MPVNNGELYYSSVGILEIVEQGIEKGVKRVKVKLHQVDPNDGVTPNGDTTLMTTPEINVDRWIRQFLPDMAQRKRSVGAVKSIESDRVLAAIEQAVQKGKPERKALS